MRQLLAHLIGAYCIQPKTVAVHKVSKGWAGMLAALTSALLYSMPFLLLVTHKRQWVAIVVAYYIVDRFQLAWVWSRLIGVGKQGVLDTTAQFIFDTGEQVEARLEEDDRTPLWLTVSLLAVIDATLHMSMNLLILRHI